MSDVISTIDFVFNLQEVSNQKITENFIKEMVAKLDSKGFIYNEDYYFIIKSNDKIVFNPMVSSNKEKLMIGGGNDSSFPYNIFESVVEYLDQNVVKIKNTKLKSLNDAELVDKRRKYFDNLFSKHGEPKGIEKEKEKENETNKKENDVQHVNIDIKNNILDIKLNSRYEVHIHLFVKKSDKIKNPLLKEYKKNGLREFMLL
jgi:hypothetical protein